MKRSSDLSALIDGHKPPGSTPHVGKEVPPRKISFHMLILGYKYSREEQRSSKEPVGKGSDPLPECPCPVLLAAGRAAWIAMTAAASAGGTHKLASTKEERKVGPLRPAVTAAPLGTRMVNAGATGTERRGNYFSSYYKDAFSEFTPCWWFFLFPFPASESFLSVCFILENSA